MKLATPGIKHQGEMKLLLSSELLQALCETGAPTHPIVTGLSGEEAVQSTNTEFSE